ncbi:Glutamate racemase [Trichinella spiralis]|uniref:Glutamate racemase n=1 Tax=Trichinella spiralis TaxID=6334 RepID=A0ABR3K5F7_TRISP
MESYAQCKTPVSGTSVNIKELQTTEKRNVLLSVESNVQYNAQQHLKQKFTRLGNSPCTVFPLLQSSVHERVGNPLFEVIFSRMVVDFGAERLITFKDYLLMAADLKLYIS